MIRKVTIKDARDICSIYNYHIVNTTVTFEEEPISEDEMKQRIIRTGLKFPWLVYEADNLIAGYAYASQWRTRSAYRYSAETTVYVSEAYKGRGIGTSLYKELIQNMQSLSFHSVIGGIALPNDVSVSLHEKLN